MTTNAMTVTHLFLMADRCNEFARKNRLEESQLKALFEMETRLRGYANILCEPDIHRFLRQEVSAAKRTVEKLSYAMEEMA